MRQIATFDLNAARRYNAWYATPTGRAVAGAEEALLGEMLAHLPDARTLLEVGCGTGHFARSFAARGLRVAGLDASPAMLAIAREVGGGPDYVLGSAEHLPFPDRCFDVVAFITSLEFVADPAAALREAGRVARRGLLLGVLNLASPLGVGRKAQALYRPSPYRAARFSTPWGLARLIRRALPGEFCSIRWRTTLWPSWVPQAARRLPCGGFIGMAVTRPA